MKSSLVMTSSSHTSNFKTTFPYDKTLFTTHHFCVYSNIILPSVKVAFPEPTCHKAHGLRDEYSAESSCKITAEQYRERTNGIWWAMSQMVRPLNVCLLE